MAIERYGKFFGFRVKDNLKKKRNAIAMLGCMARLKSKKCKEAS